MIRKILAQEVVPKINPDDLKVIPGQKVYDDPEKLLSERFLPGILGMLSALAVLFLIWSGYQYLASAGDPTKAERARTNLTYSIIGVILMVLAFVLVNVLSSLIQRSAQ